MLEYIIFIKLVPVYLRVPITTSIEKCPEVDQVSDKSYPLCGPLEV